MREQFLLPFECGTPRFITDMGACKPASALSSKATDSAWQVVDYETADFKGRMICAQSLVQAPEVTLPLNAGGWHAFSVGFWPGIYYDSRIKYRLSGEEIFTVADHHDRPGAGGGPNQWNRTDLLETFPRFADLTGQDLVFGKQNHSTQSLKAFIAYVKLEPLTDEQVQLIRKNRARKDTRRLLSLIDGEGFFSSHVPYTRNELLESVEPYRDSDVGVVFWGVNLGDLTYYPSDVGRFYYSPGGAYALQCRKEGAESLFELDRQGIVPYRAACEHCHSMGLEFHTYYRLSMYDHDGPCNIFSTDSFFLKDHPECRIVAKDGTPLPKASYAFPETRDFMVSLMEEAMQTEIDGVALCFTRGPEYFGYEQPIIDEFQLRYGEDPRGLPDDDPRLLDLRAEHLTEFIRQVRKSADEHGKRRGRRIQVSAWLEFTDERMRYFSYDCYRWLKEELLDIVIAENPPELLKLAREKGCRIFQQQTNHATPAPEQVTSMQNALVKGLEGIAIWDLDAGQYEPEAWAVLKRLGHTDEVAHAPHPNIRPYPRMKRRQLLSIHGRDMSHTETRAVPGGWPPEMLPVYSGG
ncbi:MAG: hypothetical protein QF541_21600 [Lentisphaeria bacterium]|nr:hypothetical protein [Lentisphaeria bacterium]